MRIVTMALILFWLVPLVPGTASASAPGDDVFLPAVAATVQMVCSDDGTQICANPQLDPNGQYPTIIDPDLGCTCVPDTIDGAKLKASLTLIADDDAEHNDSSGLAARALLLVIKGGRRSEVIADTFAGDVFADEFPIGMWQGQFLFDDESVIFGVAWEGARILTNALGGVRQKLVAIGVERFGLPPDVVPVLVDPTRDVKRKPKQPLQPVLCGSIGCGANEANALGDSTASVARYRVTIRFARPRAP